MIEIITQDRKMKELIQLAKTVAQSKAAVLIQGEAGTEKEKFAKLIHESSSRASKPFVCVDCSDLTENLIESELFGLDRGGFSGASHSGQSSQSTLGKIEQANGGTLFLDEVSDLDVRMQEKLLRVLQTNEVERLGSRKIQSVDVRIVVSSKRSLSEAVKQGTFREDLYLKLNAVHLVVPPLRDRMGDIRLLSARLMITYAIKLQKGIGSINEAALQLLQHYSWPGNTKELESVIERAVASAKDGMITDKDISIQRNTVEPDDLEMDLDSQAEMHAFHRGQFQPIIPNIRDEDKINWSPGKTLNDIERNVILEALQYHHGNRTHTAKSLGISIRTLRNKIAEYRASGIRV